MGDKTYIWKMDLGVEAWISGNNPYILTLSPAAAKVSNQSSFEISPNFSLSALIIIMLYVTFWLIAKDKYHTYMKLWIHDKISLQYYHSCWYLNYNIIIFYRVLLPFKMSLQLVQLIIVHCSFPLLLRLVRHQLPTHL